MGDGGGGGVPVATADNYEYDLIGVTVHTGTADGGHYYSFIKDQSSRTGGAAASSDNVHSQDKW